MSADKISLSEEMSRLPRPSGTFKFLNIGVGLIFVVAIVYAAMDQWHLAVTRAEIPVRKFADHLRTHNITDSAPHEVAASVAPPATKVYEMEVDGRTLWLCYFNADDARQREAMEEIRATGMFKINGKELPTKLRKPVAMAGYDGSSKETEILHAFDDYETP